MTTLHHYTGLDELHDRLRAVGARRRAVRLGTSAAIMTTLVTASLAAAAAVAGYWANQPPTVLRWCLPAALCAGWSAALVYLCLRLLSARRGGAQMARLVEQAIPQLRNDLINPILLAADAEQPSAELVQRAIDEAAGRTRDIDLPASVSVGALRRWSLAAAVSVAVLVAFAAVQWRPFVRGLQALVDPGGFVPRPGRFELLELSPGDVTIFAGESVTIAARIRNPRGAKLAGRVIFKHTDEPSPMLAADSCGRFSLPMGPVTQSFSYAVLIGDGRYPLDRPFHRVTVLDRPQVRQIRIACDYPAYTRLDDETLVKNAADASFDAPVGTVATVTAHLTAPVAAMILERRGAAAERMTPSPDGRTFSSVIRIDTGGGYRLVLQDAGGRRLRQLPEQASLAEQRANPRGAMSGYYRIGAKADPPPTVEFLAPAADISAAPGEKIAMRIRAADKYALASIKVFAGLKGRPAAQVASRPSAGKGADVFDFEYVVDASLQDDAGLEIIYYATATDGRELAAQAAPQTATSSKFRIHVRNAATVATRLAMRRDELRRRLSALLELQAAQRVNTGLCAERNKRLTKLAASSAPPHVRASFRRRLRTICEDICAAQRRIKAEMIDLVENFAFDGKTAGMRQALALLAGNEAQVAIEQSGVLRSVILAARSSRPLAATRTDKAAVMLAGTQDRIIDVLQTLLAICPPLSAKAGEPSAGGADLPGEALRKVRDLAAKLREFIDAERKAIQAATTLAKTPVDNFDTDDIKLLKDLLAAQDKWEKFLDEAAADFSRLALQDFSNPLLLKELISVKTDVTMARDALSKQAVETATAAESSAIENASTLTANLEKWLPDEPDRTKWAMEAPTEQLNVEMPELPTELEDLVGDLLEEEEDLFDEMQDVTSKAAASLDKGAGWDAMDGPISSMNAQGVTGNQLPNTSEISGRSGEGRTGKSLGEYVEDKAVGKGGRRTPTRLTNEAFSKGQIDDKSSEPPGGATGGGKVSGAGAAGLEGPLPSELKQHLKRLAGKQATLINRAERIRARFRVGDYANFKLLQAITLMDRVRADLQRGRYHNALRARRETLDAIARSRLLLTGKIDVTTDASADLPKYMRDDISQAMQSKLPVQFRSALRQYYRRISKE